MTESLFYFRFFDSIKDRIDENYNNPKYDTIAVLLNNTRYNKIIDLDNKQYLIDIVSGKTPKGIQYIDDGVPFLGSTQILFGKIELDTAPRISREIHETKLASSQIKKDYVLITMAGTIGRCAVYTHTDECNANQAIAILNINKNEIEQEYLIRYLNSDLGQLFFGKLQHISSQPNINLEEIKKIKVILPSKIEQHDILTKVRLIESEAINLENEAKDNKKKAESILHEELSIEVPDNEMLNYFFKSGAEKRTLYFSVTPDNISNRINYLFYHPKLTPLEIMCERYKTVKLENICIEPIHRGEQPEYIENEEVVVIKTVDLKNTYIDYENCLRVSRAFYEKVPTAQVKKGDVLIASTGYGSMGKVDIYTRDEPAIVDGHISVLRLKEEYDPYFVVYFLRSHLGRLQFEKWFSGSSGQIEIQPEDLNQFILPQCSEDGINLIRQKEIATKITEKLNDSFELGRRAKEKWKEAKDTFDGLILKEIT